MRSLIMVCSVLMSILFVQGASSEILTVDPGGGGDFLTIQAAIDAAASGDEIQVLAGTYMENLDLLGKTLSIIGTAGSGNTILDGSSGTPGSGSCIYVGSGEAAGTSVEGFTLQGGTGTVFPTYGVVAGGGIYCYGSFIDVIDCRFEGNQAYVGAAIWVTDGHASAHQCEFLNNLADSYGSAVSCEGSSFSASECIFEYNTALTADGCVSFAYNVTATIDGCTFRGNTARAGAGLNIGQESADCQVYDCIFLDNLSEAGNGGAVRLNRGQLWMEGCVLSNNHAAFHGGGLAMIGGAADIVSCTFHGNGSTDIGGQLGVFSGGWARVERVIIAMGTESGGVYQSDGSVVSVQCSDVWENLGGDYQGMDDPTGTGGNISADPIFCDAGGEDFSIRSDSPCGPDHNPDCGLLGALPVGCTPPTPVVEMSWGRVKLASYR